jgi:hypothetical protein
MPVQRRIITANAGEKSKSIHAAKRALNARRSKSAQARLQEDAQTRR